MLHALHVKMESLHGTGAQLDPRRFDIPVGLPALPKDFMPVRTRVGIHIFGL